MLPETEKDLSMQFFKAKQVAEPQFKKTGADLSPAKIEEIGRRAGLEAAKRTYAAGLPVATIRDGWIVEVWPDGRIEKIERVPD